MPAKKKAKKPVKKTVRRAPAKRATKSVARASRYHSERDQFFVDHPNGKLLLAVFIIATAVFIGMYYRNTVEKQYVNQEYVRMDLPPAYGN